MPTRAGGFKDCVTNGIWHLSSSGCNHTILAPQFRTEVPRPQPQPQFRRGQLISERAPLFEMRGHYLSRWNNFKQQNGLCKAIRFEPDAFIRVHQEIPRQPLPETCPVKAPQRQIKAGRRMRAWPAQLLPQHHVSAVLGELPIHWAWGCKMKTINP